MFHGLIHVKKSGDNQNFNNSEFFCFLLAPFSEIISILKVTESNTKEMICLNILLSSLSQKRRKVYWNPPFNCRTEGY